MFEIIWEKSNAKNAVVGKQVTAETVVVRSYFATAKG